MAETKRKPSDAWDGGGGREIPVSVLKNGRNHLVLSSFLITFLTVSLTCLDYLTQGIEVSYAKGFCQPSQSPHLGVLKSCSWLRQVHNKLLGTFFF